MWKLFHWACSYRSWAFILRIWWRTWQILPVAFLFFSAAPWGSSVGLCSCVSQAVWGQRGHLHCHCPTGFQHPAVRCSSWKSASCWVCFADADGVTDELAELCLCRAVIRQFPSCLCWWSRVQPLADVRGKVHSPGSVPLTVGSFQKGKHSSQSGMIPGSWQYKMKLQLILKSSRAYYVLSDAAMILQKYGRALRYIKLALQCHGKFLGWICHLCYCLETPVTTCHHIRYCSAWFFPVVCSDKSDRLVVNWTQCPAQYSGQESVVRIIFVTDR